MLNKVMLKAEWNSSKPGIYGNVFEMADARQYGGNRFDKHTDISLTTFAETKIGRIPINFVPTCISKNNLDVFKLLTHGLCN